MQASFRYRRGPIRDHQGDVSAEVESLLTERLRTFFGDEAAIAPDGPEAPDAPAEGVVVTLALERPLFDEQLLRQMIEICATQRRPVTVEGAAGGTAPLSVTWAGGAEAAPFQLLWESQFEQNVQLEINRLKRLKIFLALVRRHPGMHRRPLAEILDFLASPEGTGFVLAYGEDVPLDRYAACPNCGNDVLTAVRPGNSQPRIGYLPRAARYYDHCGGCNLVFLNPVMPEGELHRLYDWYDKEGTTDVTAADFEPEAMRRVSYYQNFEMALDKVGDRLPADARTLDLGGGAGWFSVMAKRRFPGWQCSSVDFDCRHVEALLAERGVEARSMDILNAAHPRDSYDLVTMFEVVEHLRVERLKLIWAKVRDMLKPGGLFVFSTPDFDSDYARATDFWVAYVPHHVTVLSAPVLQPMWEAAGFEEVDRDARSLLFREGYGDFAYGARHHASMAARSEAAIMDGLLRLSDARRALYGLMEETRSGGEMIVTLRKIEDES
ncbi:MAG TPA: class I SAM-dependent methyltransferase [Allosphingosinicella sp.]|nr:class I SAM-dependent methyltransferase [Allosphingosinicella sp.]